MRIDLAYGNGKLEIDLPQDQVTVIEPKFTQGLRDEKAAVMGALDHPIHATSLIESIRPEDKLCILFTDLHGPLLTNGSFLGFWNTWVIILAKTSPC